MSSSVQPGFRRAGVCWGAGGVVVTASAAAAHTRRKAVRVFRRYHAVFLIHAPPEKLRSVLLPVRTWGKTTAEFAIWIPPSTYKSCAHFPVLSGAPALAGAGWLCDSCAYSVALCSSAVTRASMYSVMSPSLQHSRITSAKLPMTRPVSFSTYSPSSVRSSSQKP